MSIVLFKTDDTLVTDESIFLITPRGVKFKKLRQRERAREAREGEMFILINFDLMVKNIKRKVNERIFRLY